MNRTLAIAMAVAATALGGCASVQPRESFPHVAKDIEDRTGARPNWDNGTDQDAAAHEAVEALLGHDLTADSAVQIALLCNHDVQATYESLGIAQGELVQAGLLSNPVVNAMIRFPDSAHGSPDIEVSVAQNFIDLFSLPLKKKVADAQYRVEQAHVAGEVVSLAADVKAAFYTLQGDMQAVELRKSIAAAMDASQDAAQRIRDAGNTTELELANQQAMAAQARLDLALAQSQVNEDREKLAALLGIDNAERLRLPSKLPDLPTSDGDLSSVESLALHQNLKFTASVAALDETYRSLGIARQFAWFTDAELTVDTEHNPDGSWVTGPGIAIPVPIFDTGAAKVSIAAATARQAQQRLMAMRTQLRAEARAARAQLLSARRRAVELRTTLLPLRHRITQQTQLHYNGMLADVFHLLIARRDEIDAGRTYIETVEEYWQARTRLERAVGGQLPAPVPAPLSASAPTTLPSPPSSHE